jgi:hypothetical protein
MFITHKNMRDLYFAVCDWMCVTTFLWVTTIVTFWLFCFETNSKILWPFWTTFAFFGIVYMSITKNMRFSQKWCAKKDANSHHPICDTQKLVTIEASNIMKTMKRSSLIFANNSAKAKEKPLNLRALRELRANKKASLVIGTTGVVLTSGLAYWNSYSTE